VFKIGYARVSTSDQAVDLQVDALKQAGCAKVYTEVIGGVRTNRPVLDELLKTFDRAMSWSSGSSIA
jgi:DNA invertase Pin-like site-specific DNA recombinase